MEKPFKIIEKPFGRLGRAEGDPGGDRFWGKGLQVIYHAFRPGTPSLTGKKLATVTAKARVTAASYASFRDESALMRS